MGCGGKGTVLSCGYISFQASAFGAWVFTIVMSVMPFAINSDNPPSTKHAHRYEAPPFPKAGGAHAARKQHGVKVYVAFACSTHSS